MNSDYGLGSSRLSSCCLSPPPEPGPAVFARCVACIQSSPCGSHGSLCKSSGQLPCAVFHTLGRSPRLDLVLPLRGWCGHGGGLPPQLSPGEVPSVIPGLRDDVEAPPWLMDDLPVGPSFQRFLPCPRRSHWGFLHSFPGICGWEQP